MLNACGPRLKATILRRPFIVRVSTSNVGLLGWVEKLKEIMRTFYDAFLAQPAGRVAQRKTAGWST